MMCIALVSIGISGAALASGYGVLSAAQSRRDVDARMAATALAADGVPSLTGGSVAPAAPVDGWYDYVVVNPSTGHLTTYTADDAPESGDLILRQWCVSGNGTAGRLFQVSTTLVDTATRAPLHGPHGAQFTLSRVSE
jgi:hypothetical protein